MKTMHLAVALVALGLATPYGAAQNERNLNDRQDAVPVDQGALDCLLSLGPECFVSRPAVGGEGYVELYNAPDCTSLRNDYYVGGRDLTGDGTDDTPTVYIGRDGGPGVYCAPSEGGEAPPAGRDGANAASHCQPWIHVHGYYSGGVWQGATQAHLHHNNYSDCHLYGGYWSYTGNCGSASYYSHDTFRVTFCDGTTPRVCMNLQVYSGEWTGWTCWYQYN